MIFLKKNPQPGRSPHLPGRPRPRPATPSRRPAPAPPAPSRPIRAPAAVFIALAAFGSASFSPKSSVESTISAHDAVFVSK